MPLPGCIFALDLTTQPASVDNFGELEGRLVNIEKELIRLTDSIQGGNARHRNSSHHGSPDGGSTRSLESEREWVGCHNPTGSVEGNEDNNQKRKRKSVQQSTNAYAVHYQYHEPCTLLSLCNELRDLISQAQRYTPPRASAPTSATVTATATPLSNPPFFDEEIARKDSANTLMTTLCSTNSAEETLDFDHESNTILLPPKQFLVMACTPFFQQEDPAIDLFSQSPFWANVDRIYNKPFTSADNAWALCFNNMILLVMGAGQSGFGSDAAMGSHFAMPFISTLYNAVAYPNWLKNPELINVQALALLSVTAQQYLPPSIAEATFARACRLAKKMGLHQQRVCGARIPSEEDKERLKVFRSLFLRDKTFSITRGLKCCLSSLDCSISFALGNSSPIDTVMFARLQLARLQEEIYRALYSSESFPLSTNQRRAAINRIEESLRQWAEAYEDPQSAEVVQAIDVQLDFRASRILALRSSSDPKHTDQLMRDARASCLLLSTAVGRIASAPPSPEALPVSLTHGNPSSLRQSENEHTSLRIRSIAESFSLSAFFALIKNLIWPRVEDPDGCDIELLETVSQIFQDLNHRSRADTYTRKVSSTFQSLLAVTHVLRPDLGQYKAPSKHEDQQQQPHYYHLTHQISQPTPLIPISPAHYLNDASGTTWQPLGFSDASPPSHSAPNAAPTNTDLSAFDFPNPLEYGGGMGQYDQSQHISLSSHGHYNTTQGYVTPIASVKDYHHQPFFTQFPSIVPMIPLDEGQQQPDNHPF